MWLINAMSNFYQFFFINSSFFFFLSCSFFVFVYAWVCVCVGGAGIFWSLCQSCLELIILSPCWVWVCVGNSDPESWGRVSSTHTHSLLTSPSILPVNSSCLHAQADAGSHFLEYILEYNTVFLFFFLLNLYLTRRISSKQILIYYDDLAVCSW